MAASLVLAALLLASALDPGGVLGDSTDYLQLALQGDGRLMGIHYGYILLLELVARACGGLGISAAVAQGSLSILATLSTAVLFARLLEKVGFDRRTAILAASIWLFGSHTLRLGVRGEPYMLQTALLVGSASLALAGRTQVAVTACLVSMTLGPVVATFFPCLLLLYLWHHRWRPADLWRDVAMASLQGVVLAVVCAVVWWLDGPIRMGHSAQDTWVQPWILLTSYVLAIPRTYTLWALAVPIGIVLSIAWWRSFGLLWLALASIVAMNLYFILRIEDFAEMLFPTHLVYALWASLGARSVRGSILDRVSPGGQRAARRILDGGTVGLVLLCAALSWVLEVPSSRQEAEDLRELVAELDARTEQGGRFAAPWGVTEAFRFERRFGRGDPRRFDDFVEGEVYFTMDYAPRGGAGADAWRSRLVEAAVDEPLYLCFDMRRERLQSLLSTGDRTDRDPRSSDTWTFAAPFLDVLEPVDRVFSNGSWDVYRAVPRP